MCAVDGYSEFSRVIVGTCVAALLLGVACDDPDVDVGDDADDAVVDDDNGNDNSNSNSDDNRVLDTEYQDIELQEVAGPFEHPWAVAVLDDDRQLVTERPGQLYLVDDGEPTEIDGIPEVSVQNQGGLLDVVVHPDFDDNRWIYLTYSKSGDEGNDTATAVARAELDEDDMELTDFEDVFVQNRYSSPGRHYGSRLAWMNDGTLLVTVGDRGSEPPRAQDVDDHAGTVVRIEDDGSVPDDNPFVDDDDVLDEIFTWGNRNIQGIVVDDDSGNIWATEHGPRGGDLIHRLEAGNNYGWPEVTQGLNYSDQGPFPDFEARSMEGVEDPFHEFTPTMAPSGLALVTTDRFQNWNGNLLAGGLRAERIRRVVVEDQEVLGDGEYEMLHQEELLLQEIGRIRDLRQGPEGDIWVLNDEEEAALYRVSPQ